jgi:dienelactone hydrolase
LKQIQEKTEQLRKAVAALKEQKIPDDVLVEVEIYRKAAENIVRFEEWLHANSVKWTFQTLDDGLERAKQAEGGKAVWRDAAGKWVVRAYRSRIDDSIQPYAVLLPHDYGKDPQKKWRLDIVLHGRDGSLTEAKFIATHKGAAPKDLGYVQLEPYGRGNNAYRWAGETDVFEAIDAFRGWPKPTRAIDPYRVVLRGFSMGGAGTWHIGLHHPTSYCVSGPGAGFTTTHGYIANLPKELPDYQEKCLRIYDAVRYAENAFNVPVVAYSGELDAQKKAADNIENALKGFREPVRFTHLVAPGLEHQMPADWQAKAEAEYRKYADPGRDPAAPRVRFVTHHPRYGMAAWLTIDALTEQYERATADGTRDENTYTIRTSNVRRLTLRPFAGRKAVNITLDGQTWEALESTHPTFPWFAFEKRDGRWAAVDISAWSLLDPLPGKLIKCSKLAGPIDDAFMQRFFVVAPSAAHVHAESGKYTEEAFAEFGKIWDRYFRGKLPTIRAEEYDPTVDGMKYANLVLFGDPQSNPLIAKVLPKLPVTWTKDKLVVNGVEYDPKTHVPVLIYPNPLNENRSYVVINSGHTFKEADLKGTNALLYPRLGDWAVVKPTPTEKDPAAYEVGVAGLFDENWQFPKKK